MPEEDLSIETEKTAAGVQVMRLKGPLVLGGSFEFQDLARSLAGSPLVVDLSAVPYMDSAGLGSVLSIMASCQRKGMGFAVAGVAERIQTLFSVTRVDNLIPSFPTVGEAEAHAAAKK
jgi:anti-anti-sigma factor